MSHASVGPRGAEDGTAGRAASRAGIAARALELADREGLQALSMRRLAAELGMGTMTLYGYFRDKDDLLAAVADEAAGEPLADTSGMPWDVALRTLMRQVRGNLARHPSVAQLRLLRPLLNPAAMRVTEAAMRALEGAGFPRADAARAYRTLFLYTFGDAAFNSPEDPEAARDAARAHLAALPPRDYPAVAASIEEAIETLAGDEQFEYGLDVLLEGLEARLGRAGGTG